MVKEKEKINIKKITVAQEVLDLVPGSVARRLQLLPLSFKNDLLLVACADEDSIDAIDRLENIIGLAIKAVEVDDIEAFKKAVKRYYPEKMEDKDGESAALLFNRVINRALQLRASDVHIVPGDRNGMIKMRIDGLMRNDREISAGRLTELTSVIKIAADLDIAEKRIPLDGNINLPLFGDEIALRVATIPTIYGEHITLRLLTQDDEAALEQLDALGLEDIHYKLLLDAISEPNGIILLSGPTGSGKTTTLYAALRHLRRGGGRHLVSIEDPVEKPVSGVTQIKIDSDSERITFNKALRSVLRHDPDVIMVGEIRDGETGDIAVKSALTGHLVLSTLHTNSAAGVLTRLMNLGIAPFLVASTLRLAIAQRLVRIPCSHCVTYRKPTAEECGEFGWDAEDENLKVPEAAGCDFCGGSGNAGRLALYEMIPVDREIRKLILKNTDEQEFAD
ncbi:MAG: GspE/PulE family protein, partial [Victivallaceae bacterium]|nr:GspE/PulE family protein [Victivallaceae bacterium]